MTTGSSGVLSVGELLWDLLPTGPVLGGAPANLAYRIVALGGVSRLVSRVGQDAWGERALLALRDLRLDGDLIQVDPRHPTGTVRVTLLAGGGHEFEIMRDTAYDFIEPLPEALEAAATASAVCFGTLMQRSPGGRTTLTALLEATRAPWLVCDVNLRRGCYSEDALRWSTARANVIKLNDDEIPELARLLPGAPSSPPAFARAAVEAWGLRACVVTLGERGALAVDSGLGMAYEPGFRVAVCDTIGSGDAFTAAFLMALMDGLPLARALRHANALGALVATQQGAMQPVTSQSIDDLVSAPASRVVDPLCARVGG